MWAASKTPAAGWPWELIDQCSKALLPQLLSATAQDISLTLHAISAHGSFANLFDVTTPNLSSTDSVSTTVPSQIEQVHAPSALQNADPATSSSSTSNRGPTGSAKPPAAAFQLPLVPADLPMQLLSAPQLRHKAASAQAVAVSMMAVANLGCRPELQLWHQLLQRLLQQQQQAKAVELIHGLRATAMLYEGCLGRTARGGISSSRSGARSGSSSAAERSRSSSGSRRTHEANSDYGELVTNQCCELVTQVCKLLPSCSSLSSATALWAIATLQLPVPLSQLQQLVDGFPRSLKTTERSSSSSSNSTFTRQKWSRPAAKAATHTFDTSRAFAWGLFAYAVTSLSLSAGREVLGAAVPYVAGFRAAEVRSVALAVAKLNCFREEGLMRALCERLWELQKQQQQQKQEGQLDESDQRQQQLQKGKQGRQQQQQQRQQRHAVERQQGEQQQQQSGMQQALPFCDMAWAIAVLNMKQLAGEARRLAAAAAAAAVNPTPAFYKEQLCQLAQVHMWLRDEIDCDTLQAAAADQIVKGQAAPAVAGFPAAAAVPAAMASAYMEPSGGGWGGRATGGLAGFLAPEVLQRCEVVWRQLQQEESNKREVTLTQQQVYDCLLRLQRKQQHQQQQQQEGELQVEGLRLMGKPQVAKQQEEEQQKQPPASDAAMLQAEQQREPQQQQHGGPVISSVELQALTPDGLMCMDVMVQLADGTRIAVEVDGPDHFLVPCGGPTGGSCFRGRALARRGFIELSVPYFDWDWGKLRAGEDSDCVKSRGEGFVRSMLRLEREEGYLWARIVEGA